MARIAGVTDEKAGLVSRGLFELLLDSSSLVERRLRWLGVIKTAMLVGCPA